MHSTLHRRGYKGKSPGRKLKIAPLVKAVDTTTFVGVIEMQNIVFILHGN